MAPDRLTEPSYDRGVVKVIVFASTVIIFSMLLIGAIVYMITKEEAVNKLKTWDLPNIAQSIGAKVEGRIDRAIETSQLIASDPAIVQWIAAGEQDAELGEYAAEKIHRIARDFDYSNAFIVSALTRHYWSEEKRIIDTISEQDPSDRWFFQTLDSGRTVSVVIDYNEQRNDTFIFVNVVMENQGKKIGVAGIGMSLKALSNEFQSYKHGEASNLWLIDKQGRVFLSDNRGHINRNIRAFLPESVADGAVSGIGGDIRVTEYVRQGERIDMVAYPIRSSDLMLLYRIPRNDNLAFLQTILYNTIIATLIALVSIVFFFFYVSRKLANPYKRALQINRELEAKVQDRTKELVEQNEKVMDSIAYAQRIQQSLLPADEQLERLFKEHFVLWEPRDLVGGDFYWVKRAGNGYLAAIGDCTGHGVPGALMTVMAISMLNQIVERQFDGSPSNVLGELNRQIKRMLRQETKGGITDDGLDLGLCYVYRDKVVFSGARCTLYVQAGEGLTAVEGDRKSIGYRRVPDNYDFADRELPIGGDVRLYLSTDGCYDQNGGPKGYSFGKKRFMELIGRYRSLPLAEQKRLFAEALSDYRGNEPQRDDVTILAFRP